MIVVHVNTTLYRKIEAFFKLVIPA